MVVDGAGGADAEAEPGQTPPPAQEQVSRAETEPVPDAQTMAEAPTSTETEGISTTAKDEGAHDGGDERASEVQAVQTVQETEDDHDLSSLALKSPKAPITRMPCSIVQSGTGGRVDRPRRTSLGIDGEGQTIRIVLDDGLPHETGD